MFLSDKRHTFVFPILPKDGIRPYALLFCLSWFQKKEKKPVPTPQVYDVDLMNAEQENDPLDVPVPPRSDLSSRKTLH
ncbi:hypothetical protein AZE42_06095 [Rhizopogon vesiculosus]|uniref:Uncharacterized protein n=1 Tax=Rhizopogon vesiculosus TaxID=180088 RepID=A0A1J8Q605_9AGAM|nr:hypothetical protein AZE42_06095 [Rhizopogon vesiculosus]